MNLSLISSGMGEHSEERKLIERAKHDRSAFGSLYKCHYSCIANYIFRRVGDVHLAEDLTAEVFLSAFKGLGRFRHQGVSIRSWLYRIASNRVNRWARRERGRIHRSLAVDHVDTRHETEYQASLTKEIARQALVSLPVKYQDVIALHHLEGMPIAQVAATLGCRIGTVKSRLARGRKALRHAIERSWKHEH